MTHRTLARHIAVRLWARLGYGGVTRMFAGQAYDGLPKLPPRSSQIRRLVHDELCRIDARRVMRWCGPAPEPRPIPPL